MSREHRQPSGTPPSLEPNISATMDSHELVLSRRVRNACTIATTIQVRHGRVCVGLDTCVLGMSFGIITVPGFPPKRECERSPANSPIREPGITKEKEKL